MVKKKIDPRVRTLVENGVTLRQRTMFVLVGDRGRDQVVNLHYMLSKAMVSQEEESRIRGVERLVCVCLISVSPTSYTPLDVPPVRAVGPCVGN